MKVQKKILEIRARRRLLEEDVKKVGVEIEEIKRREAFLEKDLEKNKKAEVVLVSLLEKLSNRGLKVLILGFDRDWETTSF